MGIFAGILSVVAGFFSARGSAPAGGVGPIEQPSFWDRVLAGLQGGLTYYEAVQEANRPIQGSSNSSGNYSSVDWGKYLMIGLVVLVVLFGISMFRRR